MNENGESISERRIQEGKILLRRHQEGMWLPAHSFIFPIDNKKIYGGNVL